MTPKLSNELRDAVQHNAGKPVEVEDEQHQVYILMTRQEFARVVYDDSELTPDEMLTAAAQGLADDEGWNAPGMVVYDQHNSDSPKS
jgi:hypothetical protein